MDLLELENELARVKSAVDNWTEQKQFSAQEGRESHAEFLQDQHGEFW